MGIKKIARPMNKAKNDWLKWLKDNNATDIDVFEGDVSGEDNFTYYRSVDAFIGDCLYVVQFMVWGNKITIDYSDDNNNYRDMSIEEFTQMIN